MSLLLTDEDFKEINCPVKSCKNCPLDYKDRNYCGFEDKVAKSQALKFWTELKKKYGRGAISLPSYHFTMSLEDFEQIEKELKE